ncbi:MAG: DUF692 domain-containing protein [Pseudomonadales bacterium]|nr:DUF692 domain-containing protein [Pseudomonadales bacterium]
MAAQFSKATPDEVNFLEVAPENWIGLGGRFAKQLRAITERTPLVAHGLSLSIGGPAPLDETLVHEIKKFMLLHQISIYSEHLSYCSDGGQLYDLLPIPFTEEAVMHTATRVKRVQDILEQRITLENSSYYLSPQQSLSEAEFITAVIAEADCNMLLDINNVYVNSTNHGYDAMTFIRQMPAEKITYFHIAGHYLEPDGIIVDTHGADVIDPVWALLNQTYTEIGIKPTLLERDFNIPAMDTLLQEVNQIHKAQQPFI